MVYNYRSMSKSISYFSVELAGSELFDLCRIKLWCVKMPWSTFKVRPDICITYNWRLRKHKTRFLVYLLKQSWVVRSSGALSLNLNWFRKFKILGFFSTKFCHVARLARYINRIILALPSQIPQLRLLIQSCTFTVAFFKDCTKYIGSGCI